MSNDVSVFSDVHVCVFAIQLDRICVLVGLYRIRLTVYNVCLKAFED